MTQPRVLTLAAALFAACLAPADASALRIIAPLPGAVVTQNSVLVLGAAPKGSEVRWSLLGAGHSDKGTATVDWGEMFEIFFLLDPGRNEITVGDQHFEVFYNAGGLKPPEGFTEQRMHAGDISRCEDCHDAATMALRDRGYPEVCLGCHVVESQNPRNDVDPRRTGHFQTVVAECGRCHEAHVSRSAKLLRKDSVALCGACHQPQAGGAERHPAYEEGGCSVCHDAHYSGYPKELKEPLPGVCQHCHEQGAGLEPAKTHKALTKPESCSLCHDAHANSAKLLRYSPKDVCTACHAPVMAGGHKGELAACDTCHDPHLALGTGLLKPDVAKACAECHDDIGGGKTVHAALGKGCQACHDPHRDDNVAKARTSCGRCHDLKGNRELASIHGDLNLPPGSCVGCHPAHSSKLPKLVRANVHYPLTQGKCSVCHGGGDERSIKVENPADRCRFCHAFEKEMRAKGETVHDPVASGECTTCHDPHMSNRPAFLRRSEAEICRECHEVADADKGRVLHPPAETCTECHGAHGGGGKKFLSATGPKLCLNCHDDPREAEGELHPALEEGCQVCHDPHAGFAPGSVRGKTPTAACLECHDDPAAGAAVTHAPVAKGCQACHAPHRSEIPKFLKAAGNALCRSCHAKLSDHHRASPAMSEKYPGVKSFPVDGAELACGGCHAPHGAAERRLFGKPRKDLCAACHAFGAVAP